MLTLLNSVDSVCGSCLAGLDEAELWGPEQLSPSGTMAVQRPAEEIKGVQQGKFMLDELDDSEEDAAEPTPDLYSPLPIKSDFNMDK